MMGALSYRPSCLSCYGKKCRNCGLNSWGRIMIAKMIKGTGFRGTLEYDLRQEKGQLLDTNMAGDNPRTLARESGEVRALRPNLRLQKLVDNAMKENTELRDFVDCLAQDGVKTKLNQASAGRVSGISFSLDGVP